MATQKVFIENTNGTRMAVGNSMSTTYTYNPGTKTLKVFWKRGEPVVLQNVTEGEPIWVNCWGGIPELKRVKLPRRKADCLAWLMDFSKETRTHSKEEYENLLERQRESYDWWNYQEYTRSNEGWSLTLCNRSDCGGVHHIACYISDEAAENKDAVKTILKAWSELRWMYYPKEFVKGVLRDRFGFTESDLEEVIPYLGDE
jgi:hypothetical protein